NGRFFNFLELFFFINRIIEKILYNYGKGKYRRSGYFERERYCFNRLYYIYGIGTRSKYKIRFDHDEENGIISTSSNYCWYDTLRIRCYCNHCLDSHYLFYE